GLGQSIDGLWRTGEKVPSFFSASTVVALHDVALLLRGHVGCFARIKTQSDDIEFLANIELEYAERAAESLQKFSAEHRALVVTQIQYDRASFGEIIAESDLVTELVAKFEIGGHFGIQVLLDAHEFESRRTHVGRGRHYAAAHGPALSEERGC